MISATVRQHIDCEPHKVFDFFCDLRNEPTYNRQVSDIHQTSPGPIGQGTTFTGRHLGLGAVSWTLAEYQAPSHVVVEGMAGKSPYRWVGDFEEAEEGGTEMTGRMELEPKGLLTLLGPVLGPVLGHNARRAFYRMAEVLERPDL